MKKFNDGEFLRITKADARQLYSLGYDVYFCPCNLRPGGPYSPRVWINSRSPFEMEADKEFSKVENSFLAYNCTSSETGKYIAFYIRPARYTLHFTFEDGSNPWYFYGDYKEILRQVKRWQKLYTMQPEADREGFFRLAEKGGKAA